MGFNGFYGEDRGFLWLVGENSVVCRRQGEKDSWRKGLVKMSSECRRRKGPVKKVRGLSGLVGKVCSWLSWGSKGGLLV